MSTAMSTSERQHEEKEDKEQKQKEKEEEEEEERTQSVSNEHCQSNQHHPDDDGAVHPDPARDADGGSESDPNLKLNVNSTSNPNVDIDSGFEPSICCRNIVGDESCRRGSALSHQLEHQRVVPLKEEKDPEDLPVSKSVELMKESDCILTEQTLRAHHVEHDDVEQVAADQLVQHGNESQWRKINANYVLSQLLSNEERARGARRMSSEKESMFTREFVTECCSEEEDDEEDSSWIDLALNTSLSTMSSPANSITSSSFSRSASVDYGHCEFTSSPDSSNGSLLIPESNALAVIGDDMTFGTERNRQRRRSGLKSNGSSPSKKSRFSILNAFGRRKKRDDRSNSVDFNLNAQDSRRIRASPQQFHVIKQIPKRVTSPHYDHGEHSKSVQSTKLEKAQKATKSVKSPRINVRPQNEHQETHPVPPGKRVHHKNGGRKYRNNIDHITKQLLAGSHVQRIANKLHNMKDDDTEHDPVVADDAVDTVEAADAVDAVDKGNGKEMDPQNGRNGIEAKRTESDDDDDNEEEGNHRGNEKDENEEMDHNPYLRAVAEIRQMPSYDTPEDKIQCVVRTADLIKECIDEFYENRRAEPIQITPDDLLSLFAYILTQANLHCLWAEVDLIEDFVVDNLRNDMPGYYLATLSAAMKFIANDIDKLTEVSMLKKRKTPGATT